MIVRVHRSSAWAVCRGPEFYETEVVREVLLRDPVFHVDQAGRLRALAAQAAGSGAELHAWVEGEWVSRNDKSGMVTNEAALTEALDLAARCEWTQVAYRPAERGEFFRLDGSRAGEAVFSARWALFTVRDGRAVLLVDE